ncbi:MAG TPA: hypothetical protein VL737_04220 [Candidatus Pristimantibacillus sp.]|nr:hypothetical protein [Candidatus Pristimantibacillus sp.]
MTLLANQIGQETVAANQPLAEQAPPQPVPAAEDEESLIKLWAFAILHVPHAVGRLAMSALPKRKHGYEEVYDPVTVTREYKWR